MQVGHVIVNSYHVASVINDPQPNMYAWYQVVLYWSFQFTV